MKKITHLLLIGLFAFMLAACGSKNNADNRLGKLKLEIPSELKDKPEAVAYIKGMNKVVDDYAMIIDNALKDVGDLVGKSEDELSMLEKMRLIKATGEITIGAAPIMAKWVKYMEERELLINQLSNDELIAMESSWKRLEQRMKQIEEKYSQDFELMNNQ